jgi:putative nucleotidyltransferase with HDIG domain
MSTERAPNGPPAETGIAVLITLVASATSVIVALSGLPHAVAGHYGTVALFIAVTLVLQLGTVSVYNRGAMGFAGVGLLATGFAFGVGVAMTAALATAALNLVRRRGKVHKAIFDGGQLALASAAGVGMYEGFGGPDLPVGLRITLSIAAGVAFFAVNTGLVSVAIGLTQGVDPRSVWVENFRWMLPYFAGSGFLALTAVVAYEKIGPLGLLAFALPPAAMMVSTRQYISRTEESVEQLRDANEELKARAERIQKTHLATIGALARSMEAKDGYTGGHTERVSDVAAALAVELGFDEADVDGIRVGALLHDIGKIGVPEQIINKPGPLDADEWKIMKQHPVISDFILSEIELHPFVCQIARHSHERIDGAGYPDGLAGEAIPLPARIVLVADALDALTSDRSYRRGRSVPEALDELRAHVGTQFCGRVVAALERIYDDLPELLGEDDVPAPTPIRLFNAA